MNMAAFFKVSAELISINYNERVVSVGVVKTEFNCTMQCLYVLCCSLL